MTPIRYAFGLHLHQPVGNLDPVFREHVDEVYRPFLARLAESELLPASLHVSGPLLDWLEANDDRLLDLVGRLVADGRLELLLSGYYEPVLSALDRPDRLDQIGWMREALARRFGVEARGLWMTERVWEPGLPRDLAEAGVDYVVLDDRHFMAAGIERSDLHAPWRTESEGRGISVLPIDERLRYLVPFRPAEEIAAYLRALHGEGHALAVLADDGEKFGGWPGTRGWVWGEGWLERYLDELARLVDEGIVVPSTLGDAVDEVPPRGLVYLPTASYREMEGWALPPEGGRRFRALEEDLGRERLAGPDGAFVRGGHWKGFLVRYRESNRMHKKARALSTLCRERGDPEVPRRSIGRAQCNDAYWHGVFGGLYIPYLRAAVWRELARAEAQLRREDALAVERTDLYGDGREVLWVHGPAFSAVVTPYRGGVVEELTIFRREQNLADVLTRRREAYHLEAAEDAGAGHHGAPGEDEGEGTATIHDLEGRLRLDGLPPIDGHDRGIGVDRLLAADATAERAEKGEVVPIVSWAARTLEVRGVTVADDAVEIELADPREPFRKRIRFGAGGELEIAWWWAPQGLPSGSRFAPELSLAADLPLDFDPAPLDVWKWEIQTVSKSEKGFDRQRQGWSVTPVWEIGTARATVRLRAP